MADNIKVAVRVRPFNSREELKKSRCVIKMEGQKTTIVHPETAEEKSFVFDYSYWSHQSGDEHFANQNTVFQDLGTLVLENAFQGYNTSLFAYGQTGSGKSYSMVGYGEDKGIIPCACAEMFRRIDKAPKDGDTTYRVETSMMEIYNERVRDLFNPKNKDNASGLKVRENPKTGPYVDGLSLIAVEDFDHIEQLMEQGTRTRTVASTQMNATSSRAHTIFTIIFAQTKIDKETMKVTDKVSRLSLVDLAGSERANSTGATGDRLKEGASINKSLSALGNCISSLADASTGVKKGKVHIPYRDSVLTWLLKESLGGNAKSIMIAALSPADINYEETLSTLRYADRAKQIQNTAVVNEDPNEKLIRDLKEEVDRLRKLAEGIGIAAPGDTPDSLTDAARREAAAKHEKELAEYKEQLAESQKLIEQMNKSWEEKLKEAQELENSRMQEMKEMGIETGHEHLSSPQLININEDPVKTGAIIYALKGGTSTVGRPDAPVKQTIKLMGLNVAKEHCTIENEEGKVTVCKVGNSRTWINGVMVDGSTVLTHNDRVLFGNNHLFRFNDPKIADELERTRQAAAEAGQPLPPELVIDWDYAQAELAMVNGSNLKAETETSQAHEDLEKAMKELREKMTKEIDELKHKLQEQEEELKRKEAATAEGGATEQELEEQRRVVEETKKELEENIKKQEDALKAEASKAQEEEQNIRDQILAILPLIAEANTISEELEQDVSFELKILSNGIAPNASGTAERQMEHSTVAVSVVDQIANTQRVWTRDKFMERIFLFRDYYYTRMVGDVESETDGQENPFEVLDNHLFVGSAVVFLDSLYHLLDIDLSYPVINRSGKSEGQLRVQLGLVADTQDNILKEFDGSVADDIELLRGDSAFLKATIVSGSDLPETMSSFYVSFEFADHPKYSTHPGPSRERHPEWDTTMYCPVTIDSEFLEKLLSSALTFEVWGIEGEVKLDAEGAMSKELDEKARELEEREARVQALEEGLRLVSKEILVVDEESDSESSSSSARKDSEYGCTPEPHSTVMSPRSQAMQAGTGNGFSTSLNQLITTNGRPSRPTSALPSARFVRVGSMPSSRRQSGSPEPFAGRPPRVQRTGSVNRGLRGASPEPSMLLTKQLVPPPLPLNQARPATSAGLGARAGSLSSDEAGWDEDAPNQEVQKVKVKVGKVKEKIALAQKEKEDAQAEVIRLKAEAEKRELAELAILQEKKLLEEEASKIQQEAIKREEEAKMLRMEKDDMVVRLNTGLSEIETIKKEKEIAENELNMVKNRSQRELEDLQNQLEKEREEARKVKDEEEQTLKILQKQLAQEKENARQLEAEVLRLQKAQPQISEVSAVSNEESFSGSSSKRKSAACCLQ